MLSSRVVNFYVGQCSSSSQQVNHSIATVSKYSCLGIASYFAQYKYEKNIRGIVVIRVYDNARQFSTANQLGLAIRSDWKEIS